MNWVAEITDTFGGQANYSWCCRYLLDLPDGASTRQIVTLAKRVLGLTGVRCRRFDYGDGFELRPVGSCTVAFILPQY